MEAIRCDITAYTASFRLPGIMGYQTTSLVPPPSTVFGLLSAAVGRDITPEDFDWIAYRFTSAALATDLEKIIAYGEKGPVWDNKLNAISTVPIKREFLYLPHLVIYLPPSEIENHLKRPRYPICLGRSQDVATIDLIKHTSLNSISEAMLEGTLVPFPYQGTTPASAILSFPTYMQTSIPRTPANVRMFHVVTKRQKAIGPGLYNEEGEDVGVHLLTREILMSSGR